MVNATFSDSEGTFLVNGAEVRDNLSGQSDLSYNLIGYYEKHGFSARVAFSHRSDFGQGFTAIAGLDDRLVVDDRNQIDLSASYEVNDNLTISFDALNVTGEDFRRTSEAGLVTRFTDQDAIYVLGVRYKL